MTLMIVRRDPNFKLITIMTIDTFTNHKQIKEHKMKGTNKKLESGTFEEQKWRGRDCIPYSKPKLRF